jgi:benzoyl-CoA reductase/2-hydroxyglutaryl-CoA dehydratase subunit BcrC/BadD/HgdB
MTQAGSTAEKKGNRPPPDPNSAKYKLNAVVEKHYREAWDAKERGEKVGWCASNFPQELFQTLGIKVVYPENQAAAIAARGGGARLCEVSEGRGYSNDLCAYARISLAYAQIKEAPEQDVPEPDFLLCCNNICNCMIKWYECLARELDIPLILIDIPFNPDYDASAAEIAYVSAQFKDAIRQLEELSGKRWCDKRFQEVMATSSRTCRAWLEATALASNVPSPFSGFDLLNHMAVAVCARGTEEAAEAMETLVREYRENLCEGRSTWKVPEDYRIMFEGIACWPHLRATFTPLKERGMNTVATIYADAFGFIYDDFESMVQAYCLVPNCINLEHARDKRIRLASQNKARGLLVHNNRSCKLWSGFMPEMSRQIGEAVGIPVVSFDGDQADPRNFSEAQYQGRVQGLMELMASAKGSTE